MIYDTYNKIIVIGISIIFLVPAGILGSPQETGVQIDINPTPKDINNLQPLFSPSIDSSPQGGSWLEDFDVTGTTAELNNTLIRDGDNIGLDIDPTVWTKYTGNPVFTKGAAGKFDEDRVLTPYISLIDGTFHLYYTGDPTGAGPRTIGYATSIDAISYTRQNNGDVTIDLGTNGKFDDVGLNSGSTIYTNGKYRMWYSGWGDASMLHQIGHATSDDGLAWTRMNNGDPVLAYGSNGNFDDTRVSNPQVLFEDGKYHMWYSGYDGSVSKMGYATSLDGISWTRQNNGNAIHHQAIGSIINNSGTYEGLWAETDGFHYGISNDKYNWSQMDGGNPILTKGVGWEGNRITSPHFLKLENRYVMIYTGYTGATSGRSFGIAIADQYRPLGHITSETITLPADMNWDSISVDKREPSQTSLKVSILDGTTNNEIIGFNNLSNNPIDISTISADDHPTIKVRSYFSTTDHTVSPCLYSWGVSWVANDTWRDPFISDQSSNMDWEAWLRNGEVVLDGDPTNWTKDANNPVLSANGWEGSDVHGPMVYHDGSQYVMYYGGSDPSVGIGKATSVNGKNWAKDNANPIIALGPGGSYYDAIVGAPFIRSSDVGNGHLTAWFKAYDGAQARVGYAVSGDGVNWNYSSTPVLDGTGGGTWDDYNSAGTGVSGPEVLLHNGTYHLWYNGYDGTGGKGWQTGYASSNDGHSFTKPSNSLVLSTSVGKFDSFASYNPDVLYRRDRFFMFYDGSAAASPSPQHIGYATSLDGQNWQKQNNNIPVIQKGSNGGWDDNRIGASSTIFKDGIYRIWFQGHDGTKWQIGYAESSYYTEANITSEPIGLPDNMLWDTLTVNTTEPAGTSVSISVLDSNDLVISGFDKLSGSSIDISGIDAEQYPTIKLRSKMVGDGLDTPILSDWAVNWTMAKLLINDTIPDVEFQEDTMGDDLLDLTHYFDQERYGASSLTFSIESNTDLVNISGTIDVDGYHLDFTSNVENWTGSSQFTVNATDGYMSLTSNVFTVTVTPVNDLPEWAVIPLLVFEGNTSYISELDLADFASDIDIPIGGLQFELVSIENDTVLAVTVHQAGTVDFATSKTTEKVFTNVTVSMNDTFVDVETTFEVQINQSEFPPPPNDPPAISSIPIVIGKVGEEYTYQVVATDPDIADILTYSLDIGPSGMTIEPTNGLITWTPLPIHVGDNNVSVMVTDGIHYVYQNFTINVNDIPGPPNNAPIITSNPILIGAVNEVYNYQVIATDQDADILTYRLDTAPPGMTIDPLTGLIKWTPGASNVGTNPVTVNITDGEATDSQSFIIMVFSSATNEWPQITSPAPKAKIKFGATFTHQMTATDPDAGDALTFSLIEAPNGMTIDSSTGVITWVTIKEDIGSNEVTVRVTDTRGGFAEQSFSIEVEKKETATSVVSNWWPILLVITIVIIVVVPVIATRKRSPDTSPSEQEEDHYPHQHQVPQSMTEEEPVGTSGSMEADVASVIAGTVEEIKTLPTIDDVFLIYRDGRLIAHHTRKLRPDVDDEILSSMFTAVSDFIKQSFGETGVEDRVNEISYGGKRILIEHGEYVFIATVISGKEPQGLRQNMVNTISRIEGELGTVLDGWTGVARDLVSAKKWIKLLISAKKVPKERVDDTVGSIMSKVDEPKVERPKTKTREIDGTTYSKAEFLKSLSSLPRGLPSSLWERDMDDLAEELLNGEYSYSKDGDPLVKIGRKTYYADPKDLGTFLQHFKGDLEEK